MKRQGMLTIQQVEGFGILSIAFKECGDPTPATTILDYAFEQED